MFTPSHLPSLQLLKYYHPDAAEYYNSTTDLRALASNDDLLDPTKRIRHSLKLLVPFAPMLCRKVHFSDDPAEHLFKSRDFFIEDKLDGERMLAHKKDVSVRMFSRRTNEYKTYANIMAPYLTAQVKARDVVLDGEMMAWDEDTQEYIPFGSNRTVVIAEEMDRSSRQHLCYVVFDVLWVAGWPAHPELDGELTQRPLSQRKVWLQELMDELPNRLEVMKAELVVTTSKKERHKRIDDAFAKAIDIRREGIVLKMSSSVYKCGERDGTWMKLKPDYLDGGIDTFDVAIIGGYYGMRHRRMNSRERTFSHFLLGVADRTEAEGPAGPLAVVAQRYKVFAKVGSGYTMAELKDITARLKDHWQLCVSVVVGCCCCC